MSKRIFISGGAGFIGFHLALALKKRGDFVLCLDSFNAYYDPALKKKRGALLAEEGIEVVAGDISDESLLSSLLSNYEITHVAHLAAQAGVRHSLKAPQEYVEANLKGFVSILEAVRKRGPLPFIYASSSSVYGLNKKIPFSVDDSTDAPVNLYGATKKANELIAHAYHQLYALPVTGLRFFTVYGPWGRPDMAYFRFADQIMRGEAIDLFNEGKMRRDFTYIDDIICGILAAIDLSAPCEVFNLGNHRPVELLSMIELLERYLGKKAIRRLLPMQPGEVLETYAEIEKSQRLLSFAPKVSLEEGLLRFVEWYLNERKASSALRSDLSLPAGR